MASLQVQEESQSQKPPELRRLDPAQFFPAFQAALKAYGRQLLKQSPHSLIDQPDREDSVLRRGDFPARAGRSTATELWRLRTHIRQVRVRAGLEAYVMPRTLLQWQDDASETRGGRYVSVPEEKLRTTALGLGSIALCTDGHGAQWKNTPLPLATRANHHWPH